MINSFLIELVSWLYSGIASLYNIFLYLAQLNVFSSKDNVLNPIIRRIYVAIGVVMLFFLAYSLLRTIVNPDAKDKSGTGKIVVDVIKAIIVIAIVPTAFEFAFTVQDSLLKKNTIGKIILGTNDSNQDNKYLVSQAGKQETVSDVINEAGMDIAITIFESFFYPYVAEDSSNDIQSEINKFNHKGKTYQEIHNLVVSDGNFNHYKMYADIINEETKSDGYIVYNWVFSLIAGAFCLYIMISYCLSLALRIVKLAFYEIIAPFPAMADIVPGKKDMLKKWVKVTLTTFFEAMLRIAVLFLVIYLIRVICVVFNSTNIMPSDVGFFTKRILKALLIMGCLMFAKQFPQLISEITGIDSKNMSMGIKDKLAAGGLFAGGAVVGGALTSGIRNFVGGYSNNSYRKQMKDNMSNNITNSKERRGMRFKGFVAGVGEGLLRGTAGAVSSGFRSFEKDTSDLKGMKDNIRKGSTKAGENAAERKSYKARHGGTVWGSVTGHVKDTVRKVGDYFGINSVEEAKAELEDLEKMDTTKKGVRTEANSIVDKELLKGESSFVVKLADGTELSIANLKAQQIDMENKKLHGTAEEYASAEKTFRDGYKAMSDAIQNQALLSDENWEKFRKSNESMAADLGGVREKAVEFRELLEKNLTSSTVQKAGFNLENVKADIKVDGEVIDGKNVNFFKDFGRESDLRKTELKDAITKFERERQDSDKKGK